MAAEIRCQAQQAGHLVRAGYIPAIQIRMLRDGAWWTAVRRANNKGTVGSYFDRPTNIRITPNQLYLVLGPTLHCDNKNEHEKRHAYAHEIGLRKNHNIVVVMDATLTI